MKKTFSLISFLLTVAVFSSVYAQEQITLTTYYPSPFGQYDRLRFAPRVALPAAACNVNSVGLMYYDDALNSLRVCEDIGAGPQWGSVGDNSIWQRDVAGGQVFLQNNNDKVGIGTNDPVDKLEVAGMALFYDLVSPANSVKIGLGGAFAGVNIRTRDLITNQTEYLSLESRGDLYGNLIISENNAPLEMQGLGIGGGQGGSAMTPFPRLVVTANDVYFGYKRAAGDGSVLAGAPANGNLYVRGNVGVGTETPSSKLTVHGTGSDFNTSSFRVENSLGLPILHVLDDRRLGIGTATPATPLHVVGNATIDGNIKIVDGNQGADRVLTSDATGLASWRTVGPGESVMYLQSRPWGFNPNPNPCPNGWSEADMRTIGYNGTIRVRTCFRVDKSCQVMYLQSRPFGFNPSPNPCPNGWSEADMRDLSYDVVCDMGGDGVVDICNDVKRVRTCYRCPP